LRISWRLLHDNAPSHRSSIVTDFLTKNHYFLYPKLHLAMKGNHFASIEDIQQSTTSNLNWNAIPISDIKKSFDALLERTNRCISAEGEYFE